MGLDGKVVDTNCQKQQPFSLSWIDEANSVTYPMSEKVLSLDCDHLTFKYSMKMLF